MVPGESKEGGAPQWPLSPRRTKGVPNTPRRRSWRKILGKGAPPWPLSQTKYAELLKEGGAPRWPRSHSSSVKEGSRRMQEGGAPQWPWLSHSCMSYEGRCEKLGSLSNGSAPKGH